MQHTRLLLLAIALTLTACSSPPSINRDPDVGVYVRVDSVHHVACYNRRGVFTLSCVALDSNLHAIGGH